MLGYGRDESAPTPCGVFVGYFVCECGHFAVCFVAISWINMAHLWSIHNIFAICLKCIHGTFATSSLSVCYIIAIQKYGFCRAKVWFLACKKGVFGVQKYGFCNSKVWFLFLLCNSVHNQ